MARIAPSILAADFLKLGEQLTEAQRAGADRFHVDVMDGHFVANISLGIPVIRSIRPSTSLPLEVHLMIERPERFLEPFVKAGADTLIVHVEEAPHLHRTVQQIKQLGAKAGVAVNPATPAATLTEILEHLDLVLVMTVNPGSGGQRFLEFVLPKITQVAGMIRVRNLGCELEVDGGIDPSIVPRVVEAGAGVLVAGSAVFRAPGGIAAGIRDLIEAAGGRHNVSG